MRLYSALAITRLPVYGLPVINDCKGLQCNLHVIHTESDACCDEYRAAADADYIRQIKSLLLNARKFTGLILTCLLRK
jgi:hypothetical protein